MVALHKYLNRSSKSDKIDSLTLAKMPFIDPEKLEEIYFPPAKIYAIQRLGRSRKHLESEIARKVRIRLIVSGYLPMVRKAFSDTCSAHARAFPSVPVYSCSRGPRRREALKAFLRKARKHCKVDTFVESHSVYPACRAAAS